MKNKVFKLGCWPRKKTQVFLTKKTDDLLLAKQSKQTIYTLRYIRQEPEKNECNLYQQLAGNMVEVQNNYQLFLKQLLAEGWQLAEATQQYIHPKSKQYYELKWCQQQLVEIQLKEEERCIRNYKLNALGNIDCVNLFRADVPKVVRKLLINTQGKVYLTKQYSGEEKNRFIEMIAFQNFKGEQQYPKRYTKYGALYKDFIEQCIPSDQEVLLSEDSFIPLLGERTYHLLSSKEQK